MQVLSANSKLPDLQTKLGRQPIKQWANRLRGLWNRVIVFVVGSQPLGQLGSLRRRCQSALSASGQSLWSVLDVEDNTFSSPFFCRLGTLLGTRLGTRRWEGYEHCDERAGSPVKEEMMELWKGTLRHRVSCERRKEGVVEGNFSSQGSLVKEEMMDLWKAILRHRVSCERRNDEVVELWKATRSSMGS